MKLPVVSGAEAVKAFRKLGYEFDDQEGSHTRRPLNAGQDFAAILAWARSHHGTCA